jgi:hypothetical protein
VYSRCVIQETANAYLVRAREIRNVFRQSVFEGESSLLTDSKTAAAVNCLVIEPTRNTVSTLMGTFSTFGFPLAQPQCDDW